MDETDPNTDETEATTDETEATMDDTETPSTEPVEPTDKKSIRERVWDDLEESGTARFPFPPHGRIPNFDGADEAAERLAQQQAWRDASTIKANPDAPQLPVRRRALKAGKTVYMAVPRLADERCFLKLDPDELEDYDAATTVSGSSKHGEQVGPEAVPEIDLIVSGSVAVSVDHNSAETTRSASHESVEGGRIGKGEGYSDLEYALLAEFGLVDETTTVATTVHERQLVDDAVSIGDHDVSMDLIVTPERTIRPDGAEQPSGIDWDILSAQRLEEIPVLERLSDAGD
ncbi:5-formyltetrahydrofolate cyclo-ligase [Natronorubrum daqingense]|uniref:5-formyltetrahydrofolate cyclo-ligase n=2 Tax=Natronorubrum daqingense TaxID=588898 RepID=A0A1N6ZR87_9EURY|nr:5-formyltetrahydrofolate cyclo-ligase [Natronorubrum daqingense]